MHRHVRLVSAAVAVVGVLGIAVAQETPFELTPGERTCQNSTAHAVATFGARATACIADCFARPGQSCFFDDPRTAACLDTAQNQAKIRVLQDCSGFDCPECYAGGTACDAFVDGQMFQALSFARQAVDFLFCNDSFSGDGLSRAEQRCQAGLLRAAVRFGTKLQQCFTQCERRVGKGEIANRSACSAANLDGAAFDPATQACIDQARSRFTSSCNGKCADPPDCFPFTCGEAQFGIEAQELAFDPVVYCADVPPPVCGDGIVSGGEVCDPTASPNGCPDGDLCFGCFFCEPPPPPCGNGIIDPGEVCDFNAFPTGCDAGLACTSDCTACVVPPAGFCVPTSPDTCTAGLHGCLQPCDGGTPGSACVSTSPGGAFLCVQEFCTGRPCDGPGDCFANEACFTEGCCGTPTPGAKALSSGWR